MYPQIDKPFRCIDIYSAKPSVALWVHPLSECWRFYVFSLSREQVWTLSVLGDRIYEMRCPFVAVGLNARFIVLPHWDNM